MEIKIETGIAIPKANSPWKDLYDALHVGSSFVIPAAKYPNAITSFRWWREKDQSRSALKLSRRSFNDANTGKKMFRVWLTR